MKFAFKLLAKAASVSFKLDLSGTGFQSFHRAIKIRDRITHPKAFTELEISNKDYGDVIEGLGWVLTSYLQIQDEAVAKAKGENN